MISRDGVDVPTSTLLLRVTPMSSPDASVLLARWGRSGLTDPTGDPSGDIVWIGEVAADVPAPLAAAIVSDERGALVVAAVDLAAVEDPEQWLLARLLRGVAGLAATRGTWTVALPAGPALVAAARGLGWTPRGDDTWDIES